MAAYHSKTVISRANLLALFYFRAFGRQPSRALGREKKSRRAGDVMNSQVYFRAFGCQPSRALGREKKSR
ncbi:MAG TPA: hypothetical protein VGM44_18520, partial [Polyangiaceae bacterium]